MSKPPRPWERWRSQGLTDRITTAISERLEDRENDASARLRLAHALAELPGPVADRALAALTRDAEQSIALTATAILRTRASADGPRTDEDVCQ